MTLLVILVTSLVTLLILIITSAIYLITLIVEESDSGESQDNLGLDAHDFTQTPVLSPLDSNEVIHTADANNQPNQAKISRPINRTSAIPISKRDITSANGNEKTVKFPATKANVRVGQEDSLYLAKMPNTANDELPSQSNLLASFDDLSSMSPPNPLGSKSSETLESSSAGTQEAGLGSWKASVAAQKSLITSQIGASAGKQLFDDFDPKEMQLGGTGLHWCKTRKSLDKLVKLGLPIEIVNKRQETALHVAVRRHKLQVLIGLLNHGANVECRNVNGDTPLIMACKLNDIFSCQILLVYDADFNNVDNFNLSARHYSASICDKHPANQQQLPSAAHLILAMLNEIGARRCPRRGKTTRDNEESKEDDDHDENDSTFTTTQHSSGSLTSSQCTDGCSASGQYNGNSYSRWPNYGKESLYKRYLFADIIANRLESADPCARCDHNGRPCPLAKNRSRMLCIDGGGLRGVIVCQIMIEMEKHLKQPMASYFDWLGGTSVGAFLACALSAGLNLWQLRRICFEVKDEVFSGSRPYNAKFLERVLKRTYGPTTKMSDLKGKKLAVTTVLADRDPCQLRFFRNYKSVTNLLEDHGFSIDQFNTMSGHSMLTMKSGVTRTLSQTHDDALDTRTTASTECLPKLNKNTIKTSNPRTQSSERRLPSLSGAEVGEPEPNICEQDPLVWQAVRASSAAPFFFKPYGPYLDGGLIANNPTLDMLSEFNSYNKVRKFILANCSGTTKRPTKTDDLGELESELDFVVSLGTGRGKVIGRQTMIDFGQVASGFATVFSPRELLRSIRGARDLFKKLMQQSCQTEEHILDRAQAWTSSLEIPYFRINPPLATIFSIDDKRDEQLINALWQTKLYMKAMRKQLMELGAILDGCNASNK